MPPVVIAGGIAAAGAIGGSLLGNSAQKKANKQAAQTQNNATNAQLQLGHESLDLNKSIYNSNYDTLSPFVSRGNVAGDSINALLGLPSAPAMHSPLGGGAPTGGSPAPAPAPMPPAAALPTPQSPNPIAAPGQQAMASTQGAATGPAMNALAGAPPAAAPVPGAAPPPSAVPATTATNPQAPGAYSAMQNFANSAGMQFQLDQGADMINNRYAGAGALQSGAAMKAISDYGQHTALNNYFMPYMGLLGQQQAVGAGAASAAAGVGSNFGNTVAGINGQMGNAINNGAQNIGNLQLANGQNQANMYGQIGGALGKFGSSFMPVPQY